MIEDVKKLEAKVEGVILLNYSVLQHAKIGVVETWSVEEAPVGGAKSSEYAILNECACGWHTWVRIGGRCWLWRDEVASRVVGGRAVWICDTRIQSHNLADDIWHIRGRTAGERIITIGLIQLDREARREPRDPLKLP